MPLAGITPPATLSVVPGFGNETRPISWALLDWNSSNFVDKKADVAQPSSEVLQIATLAAQSMAIIPPTPPAANSSFHVQFFGPTVQCSMANSSQQPSFDYYSSALASGSLMVVTKSLFKSGKLAWGACGIPPNTEPLMSVYSAFSPYAGQLGWLSYQVDDYDYDYSPDAFNNWIIDLPPETRSGWSLPNYWSDINAEFITQQLWVQTADQSMVCIMGNASFDVGYEFVNAAQTVAEYSISMFEPFWMPLNGGSIPAIGQAHPLGGLPSDYWNPFNSYMAMYLALSSLLNGNVSTTLTNSFSALDYFRSDYTFDGNVTIYDDSSKVLQHGLSACDEFVHSYVSPPLSFFGML